MAITRDQAAQLIAHRRIDSLWGALTVADAIAAIQAATANQITMLESAVQSRERAALGAAMYKIIEGYLRSQAQTQARTEIDVDGKIPISILDLFIHPSDR